MRRLDVRRGAGILSAIAAAAALAGCGALGSAPVPSAMAPSVRAAGTKTRAPSWMSPQAKKADLLYVSDQNGSVYVFAYPGGALVGTLTGFLAPSGLCSDARGDVFVTDTPALQIYEFRHGGKKPIASLGDFGYYPNSCSVDPSTGNLAVVNYASSPSFGPGSVSVFPDASGRPTVYSDPNIREYFFGTYDAHGNLFVNGTNYGSTESDYAELPQGSGQFTDITLNKTIGYPGGLQWDGSSLAVQDASKDVVYRVNVSGSHGTVAGATHFRIDHSTLLAQFAIQGRTIVLPYSVRSRRLKKMGLWRYPAGGAPTKTFRAPDAAELFGVTVSLAPN